MSLPFLSLFRVVLRTAGRAAFQRAGLLYLAILIAAAIIFSGNGMSASDVTEYAANAPMFRLCLWSLWLIATTPAARAVLCEPSLFVLRALPIPRLHFCIAHGFLLLVVELPWTMMFARGSGLLTGVGVAVTAMTAHCLIIARRRSPLFGVLVLSVLGLVMMPPPAVLWGLLAIVALRFALVLAFVAAPERRVSVGQPLVRGPALVALGLTYLLTLRRSHGALLFRALLLLVLGIAITILSLRNNQILIPGLRCTISLGVLSFTLLLGLCGITGPVLRSERQAEWLLAVCRVPGSIRVAATALVLALCGATLGALHAVPVAWLLGADSRLWFRLLADSVGAGITLGVVSCGLVRWAQRGTEKDTDRLLIVLVSAILSSVIMVWMFHEWALAFYVVAGFWLLAGATSSVTPSGRWLRLRREQEQGEL